MFCSIFVNQAENSAFRKSAQRLAPTHDACQWGKTEEEITVSKVGGGLKKLMAAELLLAARWKVSRAAIRGPAKIEGEGKALTIRRAGELLLEVPEDRHRCQHNGDNP